MLQFFRNIISHKLGAAIALGLLALIALAFASADVSSSGGFGGVAGGDRAASVGKQRVDTAELGQAASAALENLKQENPKISMKAFLAQGGLDQVLDQMIDRTAIGEFGRIHGIIASDRLIDSEIAKIPTFHGPDGKFSEEAFRQAIGQRGVSEKLVRKDLEQGLVARQIIVPAEFGSVVPQEFVMRYAALLRERRSGSIALLPAAAFAPSSAPGDAEVAAFYAKSKNRFIRPERRTVRYAVFGENALKSVPEPSDTEIAGYYSDHKDQFAALEKRTITQVVAPNEAIARAIVAQAGPGGRLEAAAKSKGLATATLTDVTRESLAGQASGGVADAVFAAKGGSLASPAKSGLGWHVMRVDSVQNRPERTIGQVRGEIVAALRVIKRRTAINDLSARLEDEFDKGGTLSEAAKELGLTLATVGPVTADGKLFANPAQSVSPDVARVISSAFAMEGENQPQLAEVVPGQVFMIYDVASIQPSAPAPLAEIRGDVVMALMLQKGASGARSAADKVLAAARKGTDLGAAVASLGKPLPPVERVVMGREQLAAMQGSVPAPIGLMFAMAEGTAKLLAAPENRGWFVIALKDIEPGKVEKSDPLIPQAHAELGQVVGREYAEALRRAIRSEVGVEKNATAIRAVRTQLNGGN